MNKLFITGAALVLAGACTGLKATTAPVEPSPSSATISMPAATPTTASVAVTLVDFKIQPSTTTVASNASFAVTSEGPTPHNFTIRDASGALVLRSRDLRTGESDTVSGQLAAGTYTFFCAFPGHESLGMHGTLTVTP